MYYRVYPNKNTTIFNKSNDLKSKEVNTGGNPIMELMDGSGESKLLFNFEVPLEIRTKLSDSAYNVKFRIYDAGTLFKPALKLKKIVLEKFNQDFTEGEGYTFNTNNGLISPANWNKRKEENLWSDTTFTTIEEKELNSFNEDLSFDIGTNYDNLTGRINLSLKVKNREFGSSLYRKFFHSSYTKTFFKPYLEFFIYDEIIDTSHNFFSETINKLFIVNESGQNFSGELKCITKLDENPIVYHTPTKSSTGVYFINYNINRVSSLSNSILKVQWVLENEIIKQDLVIVKSKNLVFKTNTNSVFFYPILNKLNITDINKGDILPFKVISEARAEGVVVYNSYEYRVITTSGFEIIPWTKTSIYDREIFFDLYTEYFFEETEYQVLIRANDRGRIITSPNTFNFKVLNKDGSRLRELSSSPYYSRENYFNK